MRKIYSPDAAILTAYGKPNRLPRLMLRWQRCEKA
jgi:hypothetical protein